jgi:hypothetical protein
MSFLTPKMPALPPPPPEPTPPPSFEDQEREAAATAKQETLDRKRKGRKSTILTSYQGLQDDDSVISKKTLLGS